ncbi:hypothetical protein LSTR_LSTR006619 [Laodelphax striatellus]|uniref:LEM domain-containing protein n=1 Tax=Laodelphax striatellus TaxID=195883 RepID=A0A482X8I8_LAOST|nr:hypothetical protein LSTR_LSTR006619 [Laodelphax striatellus]
MINLLLAIAVHLKSIFGKYLNGAGNEDADRTGTVEKENNPFAIQIKHDDHFYLPQCSTIETRLEEGDKFVNKQPEFNSSVTLDKEYEDQSSDVFRETGPSFLNLHPKSTPPTSPHVTIPMLDDYNEVENILGYTPTVSLEAQVDEKDHEEAFGWEPESKGIERAEPRMQPVRYIRRSGNYETNCFCEISLIFFITVLLVILHINYHFYIKNSMQNGPEFDFVPM